jgi:Amt family ammonium transporter
MRGILPRRPGPARTAPGGGSRARRRRGTARLLAAAPLAVLCAAVLPAVAHAGTAGIAGGHAIGTSEILDTLWVLLAALLVLFMQAGFLLLEVGFSRMKNVGAGVAKILVNFAIAGVIFWVVGFALTFGHGDVLGHTGFLLSHYGDPQRAFPVMAGSHASIESKWLFQFGFCAVSLAIVWGTTLERIRFGAYVAFAVVFCALIYPLAAHWVLGGGWLQTHLGMQDFAGSTAVHLIGATAALAAVLLLGPRRGKYGRDGTVRAIPGHNMPLVGLAAVILLIGWFGFNAGSTLGVMDLRFASVALITLLSALGGVLGALVTSWRVQGTLDVSMIANGMIAGLVAITAPSGYVEAWPAPVIGFVAGIIVVLAVLAIDRRLDDPVGALAAHGIAGVWGTLACGVFAAPQLAAYNGVGQGGLLYTGSPHQLLAQAAGIVVVFLLVFGLSLATFAVIRATVGLRVPAAHEDAGLDISEHGSYGYPEHFIADAELGLDSARVAVLRNRRPRTQPAAHPAT